MWRETREEVGALLTEEFSHLFKAEDIRGSNRLRDFILYCIFKEENVALDAIPTEGDIWNAIKMMNRTKAPCLDGMPALFFQKYWHIVGRDVIRMV